MYTNIYESAESGDVCHYAIKLHALFQVVYRSDIIVELECLESFARVASRFLEFGYYIVYCFYSEVCFYEVFGSYLANKFFVANKFFHFDIKFVSHFLHNMVAFRVHGACIERLFRVVNAQKPAHCS